MGSRLPTSFAINPFDITTSMTDAPMPHLQMVI